MELAHFFENISSICSYNHPVICFVAKTPQPFFFETIKKFLEKQTGQSMKVLRTEQDVSQVQAQLATSFLGQLSWYCLYSLSGMTSKKKKSEYLNLIRTYKGPHRIVAFLTEDDVKDFSQDVLQYTILDTYRSDQLKKIPILYDNQKPEVAAYFYSKLYRYKKEYSLDELCLLKEYAALLGKNMNQFFEEWMQKLIVSDVSLFYLSQLFFEKQESDFFIAWQQVRSFYSDQFWTAFFSEQLFKAYFYIYYQGQVPTAQKQLSFSLPFSFLKHDWKMYHRLEIQRAHQRIYEIDLSLKRSGSAHQLDSFFVLFFNGSFR